MTESAEIVITRLGRQGDGIGEYAGSPVYVAGTLPGERVRVTLPEKNAQIWRARLNDILEPSADRISPACPHFSVCGGCSLQHLSSSRYREFKESIVSRLLARLGTPDCVRQPVMELGCGSRRRAELKLQLYKGEVRIGYFASRSHALADIQCCPLLSAPLEALIMPLKVHVGSLTQPGHIAALWLAETAEGVRLTSLLHKPLRPADKEALTRFAQEKGLAELSVIEEHDPASFRRLWGAPAHVVVGEVRVELPPGAFQQASAQAQAVMTTRVQAHLEKCRHAVDLYAGCGAYSFPLLTNGMRVAAFEGDAEMVTAMENARRHYGLETRFTAACRDLHRMPLSARELEAFDGCVINPPRAGAARQVEQLAKSHMKHIAMVSCNPASFERDAQLLLAHGFCLKEIAPIDQFYWSAHLELVALFART